MKIGEDELLKMAKREIGVYHPPWRPEWWKEHRIVKLKWLRQLERRVCL